MINRIFFCLIASVFATVSAARAETCSFFLDRIPERVKGADADDFPELDVYRPDETFLVASPSGTDFECFYTHTERNEGGVSQPFKGIMCESVRLADEIALTRPFIEDCVSADGFEDISGSIYLPSLFQPSVKYLRKKGEEYINEMDRYFIAELTKVAFGYELSYRENNGSSSDRSSSDSSSSVGASSVSYAFPAVHPSMDWPDSPEFQREGENGISLLGGAVVLPARTTQTLVNAGWLGEDRLGFTFMPLDPTKGPIGICRVEVSIGKPDSRIPRHELEAFAASRMSQDSMFDGDIKLQEGTPSGYDHVVASGKWDNKNATPVHFVLLQFKAQQSHELITVTKLCDGLGSRTTAEELNTDPRITIGFRYSLN